MACGELATCVDARHIKTCLIAHLFLRERMAKADYLTRNFSTIPFRREKWHCRSKFLI